MTTASNSSASRKKLEKQIKAIDLNDQINFQVGPLQVRIAKTPGEIKEVQRLRYQVFCMDMGAKASKEMKATKRDFDEYDPICDHMLVIDTEKKKVVGTYRMLRRSQLPKGMKFYTQNEYDISKALKYFKGEVLELGRSCVDRAYRTRSTMQLLWRGIGEYVAVHNVECMFGCASFPGSRYKIHATHLAYLYHYCLAPSEFRPKVLKNKRRGKKMNLVPKDYLDKRECMVTLPPLIKGYLRVGAYVGDGAYKDKAYNTTDVCIVVKTDLITKKYQERYVQGRDDD